MIKTRCGLNCENCRFYQAGSCTGCRRGASVPSKAAARDAGRNIAACAGTLPAAFCSRLRGMSARVMTARASVAAVSGRRIGNSVKEQNVLQGGESRAQFRAWPEKHGTDDAECRVKVRKGRPRGSAGHGSGELPV